MMLAKLVLIVMMTYTALLYADPEPITPNLPQSYIPSIIHEPFLSKLNFEPNDQAQDIARRSASMRAWLHQKKFQLQTQTIKTIIRILQYTHNHHIEHNSNIIVIDYSLPANQKRLWVFDLDSQQLLFHTYVSHGLKSGALHTTYFSNKNDSKASSIGVYLTDKPYYGRHGISLKLDGIERGFNDNAESRAIVMHGGWYVEEAFIQKYGRAGRSWGCPAVPDELSKPIIDTIKDKSLFIVYYPNQSWLANSKFLKQAHLPSSMMTGSYVPSIHLSELRENILLAQLEKKNKYHETEAILTMPSDRYESIFQRKSPLNRMLRRQIDNQEYIALSTTEFQKLATLTNTTEPFQDVYFVVPHVVMVRGYYSTEMNKLDLGTIKTVHAHETALSPIQQFTIDLSNNQSLHLKSSHQFIRWLGL